jgi:hypothetical protein
MKIIPLELKPYHRLVAAKVFMRVFFDGQMLIFWLKLRMSSSPRLS